MTQFETSIIRLEIILPFPVAIKHAIDGVRIAV
jgi:hypothetical protein